MRIVKFVHSCLLVETTRARVLIDPGSYTYQAGALDVLKLDRPDYVLVTHQHDDHLSLPLLRALLQRFPGLPIVTTPAVQAKLREENIESTTDPPPLIAVELLPHERAFDREPPLNACFRIGDALTHPGDTLQLQSTAPVLALALQGSWTSLTRSVEVAVALRPQVVLPIHDWHWQDQAREAFYPRLESYFAEHAIRFVPLATGQPVDVD